MQHPVVLAFRKRLIKRGYTCVSIFREKDHGIYTGNYIVTAIEPLGCNVVSSVFSLSGLYHAFRF